MKILHVGNHTIPCVGGIENVIRSTARLQANAGHEVTVLVFDTCTDGKTKLPARETWEGVQIERIPHYGPRFYRIPNPATVLAAAKKADVVHVHGYGAWIDILAWLNPFYSAPLVMTTHGGYGHTPKRKGLKGLYTAVELPILKQRVSHFIAVSEQDLAFLAPLPREKATHIPNGVDLSALQKLPLTGRKKNQFLFVGRLSTNKRVDLLLEAFRNVVTAKKTSKLLIVGPDWEGIQGELEIRVKELGLEQHVSFLGNVSEQKLHHLYRESAFFVSASEYEGFGLTAIEAMAAGCVPCLNTIPTFETFVREGGGFLIPFAHSEKAGNAWKKSASITPTRLAALQKKVRSYARKFALERIVDTQLGLYEKLRSNRGL